MKGTHIDNIDGKLGSLLKTLKEDLKYTHDLPIRCDQCSEVIHQNKPLYILLADRLINESEDERNVRLMRIECPDCYPEMILYSAPGYNEFWIGARHTEDKAFTDIHLSETSPPSDGLSWQPQKLHSIIDPDGVALPGVSPIDLIRILSTNFDPREIVDPDNGKILIPMSEIESFRILFAASTVMDDMSKDDKKAVMQAAEGELTEETLEAHRHRMRDKVNESLSALL